MKAAALLLLAASLGAAATPLRPVRDAEIVQTLDGDPQARAAERAWQRRLQQDPRHAPSALALGQALLTRARAEGDARLGGRALAALQGFEDDRSPAAIVLLRATIQQHLHAFEVSATALQQLLQRPALDAPTRSQAQWLLASVRRTQGQLAASDQACAALPGWVAQACALENRALRDPQQPLSAWDPLIAQADPGTRAWLQVSKAEHALRAGQPEAAEAAFRAALTLSDDTYTRCALADLLRAQGRPAEALALIDSLPRGDAVAVRQAALARALNDPRARAWAAELRARFAQARERHAADPREALPHLREQAQFALWVEQSPRQALALAQANVTQQREAQDLLLLAEAAQAARQPQALKSAAQLSQQLGIRDERLQALL